MNIFLQGIKAGKSSRKDLLDFVNSYDQDGVTKHIKFDANGDVDKSKVSIYTYVIKSGKLTAGEEIPSA